MAREACIQGRSRRPKRMVDNVYLKALLPAVRRLLVRQLINTRIKEDNVNVFDIRNQAIHGIPNLTEGAHVKLPDLD